MKVNDRSRHIGSALDVARTLTDVADQGEEQCDDDVCLLLYGVIRDCAYRIAAEAERHRDRSYGGAGNSTRDGESERVASTAASGNGNCGKEW